MLLESLANEIISDIFECIKPAHLLLAFHNLNSRLNKLLVYYFRTHTFDFQFASNIDFDIVCQQHLLSMIDQITSIRLSDYSNIPYEIDRFLAHGFTFRQFTRLKSLTLVCNSCKQVQEKILFELHYISTELTHLTVILNTYDYTRICSKEQSESLVNIIWRLPKLIYCKIKIHHFPIPTIISTSFKHLLIAGRCSYSFHDIDHLIKYTPYMEQLTLPTSETQSIDHELSLSLTSIISLNIGLRKIPEHKIINFFRNMPNLCRLTLYMMNFYIHGHKLEQIIRNDLIKLKVLRFEMSIYSLNDIKVELVNELLKSYSTPFWLEERRWFVRCDWQTCKNIVYIYTLPYAFHEYRFNWPIRSQSTCFPNYVYDRSYNRVQKLRVWQTAEQKSPLPNIRFPNVYCLDLLFSIDNQFGLIISNFVHLTSLHLINYKHNPRYDLQMQALLDQLFHLYRLHFDAYSYATWLRPPFQLKHQSVRELGLTHIKYNNEQCAILTRTPLGMQCEVLYIYVKNRTCILDLARTMINLRFLSVQCYENCRNRQSSEANDQLIEWLQTRISSKWTIARYSHCYSPLVLWIR
ncbi:unnamed protein product [Rotaria magnacalcarata]|uniref:F-box domain-containing protein n=2 Tax=Rotaria magnacalcarata TaxID=392030 RepID=A0A819TU24_9BILA|nr:unnamed protein product [Rotaria magnacalcarata]CAF4080568.1 unnamed protein product [Rotaria magnacalcarata]